MTGRIGIIASFSGLFSGHVLSLRLWMLFGRFWYNLKIVAARLYYTEKKIRKAYTTLFEYFKMFIPSKLTCSCIKVS